MINDLIYYEVSENNRIIAFDTLEDAIEYADKNECNIISKVGGNFENFEKCSFCGEWYSSIELNQYGDCWRCEQAIKDHNGGY